MNKKIEDMILEELKGRRDLSAREISEKLSISWNTSMVYLLNLLISKKVTLIEDGCRKYWNLKREGEEENFKLEDLGVKVSEIKVKNKVTQLKVCIPKRFSRILSLTKDSKAKAVMDYKNKKVVIEIISNINNTIETFK